ncbi:MAG: hypothetical protein JWQ47_587 [Glaciihabitans sp.]|jgi:hypothetical protein|nr:hypothetical protein [Glaciihabitans sp.]
MATRWARVFRGLVASSVAVFVAAFAHVTGGGVMPGLAGLALAFAFCALASIGLAGRQVSRVRLAATVILSQGVFHLLFLMSGGMATVLPTPTTTGMRMITTQIAVTPSSTGPAMIDDGWMWLAHGIAAIVTIVALAWGERAFWRLFETVLRALWVGWGHVLHEAKGPLVPIAFVRVSLVQFLLSGLSRRGPPLAVASV